MFGNWYETDSDSCQYVRKDKNLYEMIQAVWLDLTQEDKANGEYEYCIVKIGIDLEDYTEEEKTSAIESFCYEMDRLREDFGDDADDIIAECIMEVNCLDNAYVIGDAHSFEEAKNIIEDIVNKDNH